MVPNSPTLTGKDAIGKAMKDVLADPNWSLALQPVQVEVSGAAISTTPGEPMCSLPPIQRARRRSRRRAGLSPSFARKRTDRGRLSRRSTTRKPRRRANSAGNPCARRRPPAGRDIRLCAGRAKAPCPSPPVETLTMLRPPPEFTCLEFGSSGRIRTYNPSVNSRMLYH